jgi:hypothetical protein
MNALAQVLAKILVPLFFIGMTGSLFVVILTILLDLQLVFSEKDESRGTDL